MLAELFIMCTDMTMLMELHECAKADALRHAEVHLEYSLFCSASMTTYFRLKVSQKHTLLPCGLLLWHLHLT